MCSDRVGGFRLPSLPDTATRSDRSEPSPPTTTPPRDSAEAPVGVMGAVALAFDAMEEISTRVANSNPEAQRSGPQPSRGWLGAGVRLRGSGTATNPRTTPPAVARRSEQLFSAYGSQLETVLNSMHSDWSEFWDGWGLTGRVRPDDASVVSSMLLGSVWSVARDLRDNRLTPRTFGVQNWNQVTSHRMMNLAMQRFRSNRTGGDTLSEQMVRDPLWRAHPVQVQTSDGPRDLTYDNFRGFGQSIGLHLDLATGTNTEIQHYPNIPVFQQARRAAERIANQRSPGARRRAEASSNVRTARMLHDGDGRLPANSARSLVELAETAEVPLHDAVDVRETPLSETALQARIRRGEVTGQVETPNGWVVYQTREPSAVARDLASRVASGELNHLGQRAVSDMRAMLGAHGQSLLRRMESDESGREFRAIAGEVVLLGSIGIASAGLGTLVEGGAIAVRGAAAARTLPVVGNPYYFTAQSAGFTTLYGAATGDLDADRYPIDAAMFGVMRAAAPLSRMASSLLGNSRAARVGGAALGYGTSTATAAGTITAFGGVEAWARGNPMTAEQLGAQFEHALLVVGVLHGVNAGVSRLAPQIAEGSASRRAFDRLAEETRTATRTQAAALETIQVRAVALEQATARQARGEVGEAVVERARTELETELSQFNETVRPEVMRLRAELTQFAAVAVPSAYGAVISEFGRNDPAIQASTYRASHQLQATMAERFQNVRDSLELGPQLSEGVTGVSNGHLASYMDLARTPVASPGTANVVHLASVFRENVRTFAEREGRTLSQRDVDRIFLDTVATDAFFKEVMPPAQENAPTAQTNAGATGGEVYAHMRRAALQNIRDGGPFSPDVRDIVTNWRSGGVPETSRAEAELRSRAEALGAERGYTGETLQSYVRDTVAEGMRGFERLSNPVSPGVDALFAHWVDRAAIPMAPDAVRTEAQAFFRERGLSEPDSARLAEEALGAWGQRIMGDMQFLNVNNFGLGVFTHGIAGFSLVDGLVRSTPSGATPQEKIGAVTEHTGQSRADVEAFARRSPQDFEALFEQSRGASVYEAHLGHHMNYFIAMGFARGQLRVNFQSMEAAGQLPPGAAQRLDALYETSTGLMARWGSAITRGMTPAERQGFHRDASPWREAIAGLRPEVRDQLINDDVGQFTAYRALDKWFGMDNASSTMADGLQVLLNQRVAYYLEAARAQDAAPNPAERARDLVEASRPSMEAIGATYDVSTGLFRPARPGEAAHAELARRVGGDPTLSGRLAGELGRPVEQLTADEIVGWFQAQPFEALAYSRLSYTDAPRF